MANRNKGFKSCKGIMVGYNSCKEICRQCGRSVKAGSGRFVNRVISLDDYSTSIMYDIPFPTGGYTCAECMEEFDKEL